MTRHPTTLVVLVLLSACGLEPSTVTDDIVARTYPAAGTYPELTVAEFRADTVPPGNYNVECAVRQIDTQPPCPPCPRNAECADCPYVPEGVWFTRGATETPWTQGAFIRANAPRQFGLGRRYRISALVYLDRIPAPQPFDIRRTVLVGYDVLP